MYNLLSPQSIKSFIKVICVVLLLYVLNNLLA